MKVYYKFLFFSVFLPLISLKLTPEIANEKFQAVSTAILDQISVFYIQQQIPFDMVVDRDFYSRSKQFLDIFLSLNTNSFSLELKQNHKFSKKLQTVDKSTIFFVESCTDLGYINFNYLLTNSQTKPLIFTVYINNCTFLELYLHYNTLVRQKKLTIYDGGIETFEYILINSGQILELITFNWFTESDCNIAQYELLNTFSMLKKSWKRELKFNEKFKNFHQCKLTMLLPFNESFYGYTLFNKNKNLLTGGVIPNTFKQINRKYNFKISFQPASVGKSFSLFQNLYKVDEDLIPIDGRTNKPTVFYDFVQVSSMKSFHIHVTTVFAQFNDIIIITPGELYTPYEKMILPFDKMTWIFLIVTFTVTFTIILFCNLLSKRIQHVLFGINATPMLNVLRIFFGLALVKLPTRNFSRILIMIFVMFCLIFRTCYQSKMFDFLTSERRKDSPKTINDLINMNYTLCLPILEKDLKTVIKDDESHWYGKNLL